MKIAVIGLGYVGLPLALAFAENYEGTVGFDIYQARVNELSSGNDRTGEANLDELRKSSIKFSSDLNDLRGCNFYVVAVPTPIDEFKQPDLRPLICASETVGKTLCEGDIVVYESTVYPGVTEEICGPVLARVSGLRRDQFKLGYSPERINPGDKEHTIRKITKIVSGEDEATLNTVADVYGSVVTAGVHRAPSIKVAEAAKVIENTQRDVNIALMNELAMIFDRMGINTTDVLKASGTKWNFLKFSPGLVGGHCIGVDPYYLTTKAEQLGYHPQVIISGRRINDGMGAFIAQKMIKLLLQNGVCPNTAKVGILGLTFKEDVPDIRNSRVPDIIAELKDYGVTPLVHDPHADADDVHHEYGISLTTLPEMQQLDGLVIAVPHMAYIDLDIAGMCKAGAVVLDVKSLRRELADNANLHYWSL